MKHIISIIIVIVTCILISTCSAVEVPSNPTPTLSPFWSKHNVILTVVQVAAASADATKTCMNLARGGQERWMPTQSCGGAVGFIGGGVVVNVVGRWVLERRGHRGLGTAAGVGGAVGSMAGVVYSSTH